MTAVSENRKIVVTGASSYLGRNVIEGLLEAGNWQVVGIVSPRFDTANCAMGSTNLVYLNQDLTQAALRMASPRGCSDRDSSKHCHS
jgi:nucleoside-diphosphate-sugar epimerase